MAKHILIVFCQHLKLFTQVCAENIASFIIHHFELRYVEMKLLVGSVGGDCRHPNVKHKA